MNSSFLKNALLVLFITFNLISCNNSSKNNTSKIEVKEDTITLDIDSTKGKIERKVDSIRSQLIIIEQKNIQPKKRKLQKTRNKKNDSVFVEEKEFVLHVDTIGKPAMFPGGDAEFSKFIYGNLRYPEIARENEVQGRVILEFTIDKLGNLTDIRILRGFDKYCDQEAIRALKTSPKWFPAKQNGRTISYKLITSIVFKLKN